MKIERTKNAVRNTLWGYCFKMVNILLPFMFRTIMIKYLGNEYLGINSLFVSVLNVLSLSELGFSSAIVYSMYKPIAENNTSAICSLLNYYKKIYRIIGIIMLFLGSCLTPFIPELITGDYPNEINIYLVYYLFLVNSSLSYFLFAYKGCLLNAFQRNDIESKISMLVTIFRYGAECIILICLKNYYAVLIIELTSTILQNLIKGFVTERKFPKYKSFGIISYEQRKEIKTNVFALLCHKIGGTILNSADNIVLSAFMGVAIVANYGNYYYIMTSVEGILMIVFSGLIGGIGNSFVTESTEKNRENFKRVLFFNAWVVCCCCTLLLCLYQDFIKLWLGSDFMFDDTIVFLLVCYFFTHCIRRTIIAFRDGAGMWKDNMLQPIVSSITNLIINILLVQLIGLPGVILSSIGSMVFIDIPWETHKFCKKIDMKDKEYYILLIQYFIYTSLCSGIVWIVTSYVCFSSFVNLIIKTMICLIASNCFLFCLLRKKNEFGFFVTLMKNMLSKNILKNNII